MLPIFQRELVEKRKWLSDEEVTDLFSIGQCLPGIIAANTAVFAGYKQKGVLGGIVAALGVVIPPAVFILVLAAFFTNFADQPIVQKAFIGLRVCVSILIINAVLKLRKNAVVDLATVCLFIIVFVVAVYMLLPVAVIIALAGFSGVVISMIRKKITPPGTPDPPETPDPPDSSDSPDGGDV